LDDRSAESQPAGVDHDGWGRVAGQALAALGRVLAWDRRLASPPLRVADVSHQLLEAEEGRREGLDGGSVSHLVSLRGPIQMRQSRQATRVPMTVMPSRSTFWSVYSLRAGLRHFGQRSSGRGDSLKAVYMVIAAMVDPISSGGW